MPMFDDKRKVAALIVKRISPGREVMQQAPMNEGAVSDNSIAMESAGEEIMEAIQRGDSKMLVSAIISLMEMAKEMEPEESDEGSDHLS